MVGMRWLDGVVRCPTCGKENPAWIAKSKVYFCSGKHPRQKFSLKVGTILEDSPIGLDKWFPAMWLICNAKNGISSYELSRALGVTQKTAWFMLHRIRTAMQNKSFLKMGGPEGGAVEVDEVFIGPNPERMHASRRLKMQKAISQRTHKVAVMGMLDRETRQVRTKVIPERASPSRILLGTMRYVYWAAICKTPGCPNIHRAAYIGESPEGDPHISVNRPDFLSSVTFDRSCPACGKEHRYMGQKLVPMFLDQPPEPNYHPWI